MGSGAAGASSDELSAGLADVGDASGTVDVVGRVVDVGGAVEEVEVVEVERAAAGAAASGVGAAAPVIGG